MNTKYISVISILVIVMIGLGCVDKSLETTSQKINIPKDSQVNTPISEETTGIPVKESTSENNITNVSGNKSSLEGDNTTIVNNTTEVSEGDNNITDDNSTIDDSTTVDNTTADGNTTVVDGSTFDTPANDTSVTEIFKIGEQKTMLGANIKLVNITDYENNTATISIDNVEYKYDPESENNIQAKVNGTTIEIIDLITLEDNNSAEITVDYSSQ